MKIIHIVLFSSFLTIGCSGHHHHNYERDYKHKIVKVIPEERGQSVTVVVHHQGKLTHREKKFLRKHFRKKFGHKKHQHNKNKVKIVFVLK
jgi:hypothetical protein